MNDTKRKILGQFNTKGKTVRYLVEKYGPKNLEDSILEPSSGKGNWLNVFKEKGYVNVDAYEIDSDYKNTGATIIDFLAVKLDKKYKNVRGNVPFTSVRVSDSYYGDGDTKFKTRYIEMLFLEKLLTVIEDDGDIGLIFPNRLFLDIKFNRILNLIYDEGFYFNVIEELDADACEDTNATNFVWIMISKAKSNVEIIRKGMKSYIIPIDEFRVDSNYYLYIHKDKFINENEECLGDLMKRFLLPKAVKGKTKITAGTLNRVKNGNNRYLAVVRVGNSSVGNFVQFDPDKYYFNDCFYFYEIKQGRVKDVMKCLNGPLYREYIKLISYRTGPRSIRDGDFRRLKVQW